MPSSRRILIEFQVRLRFCSSRPEEVDRVSSSACPFGLVVGAGTTTRAPAAGFPATLFSGLAVARTTI